MLATIGLMTPGSGVGMIIMGVLTIVWQIISVLAVLLWKTLVWSLPIIAAVLVGHLIFALKTMDESPETQSKADYFCGVVAGLSALALAMSQGPIASLALIAAAAISIPVYKSRPTNVKKPVAVAVTLTFFSVAMIGLIVLGSGVHSVHQVKQAIKGQEAEIDALYTVQTAEAFSRDDAYVLPLIEKDEVRLLGRMWLLHDAPSAHAYPHSGGGDIVDTTGYLTHSFRCSGGRLVEFHNLSSLSEALARRACVKRAGLVN